MSHLQSIIIGKSGCTIQLFIVRQKKFIRCLNAPAFPKGLLFFMPALKTVIGYSIILTAAITAQASLLLLALFLFYGSFALIHLNMGAAGSLIFDAFLSALFFIQHSTMVRQGFRRWLAKWIPKQFYGAFFTIASAVVLLFILVFWQKTPIILFSARGMTHDVIRCAFFVIIAGFAWGGWSLQPFDPMGLSPIVSRLRGKRDPPPQLVIRGPYRWVRHPLYLFAILLFWAVPEITADRMLFNGLWSLWIIAGAFLEERDLADLFGGAVFTVSAESPDADSERHSTRRACKCSQSLTGKTGEIKKRAALINDFIIPRYWSNGAGIVILSKPPVCL
jgi:protein-S-isoprenylcysteine O-methyltransferase Ste14